MCNIDEKRTEREEITNYTIALIIHIFGLL